MRTKVITLTALAIVVILAGCKKDNEEVNYESISELFNANQKKSEFYSFSPNETYTFTTETGAEFTFFGATFERIDHVPITGKINIELKEFYDKSDMIYEEIPTSTLGQQLLESGGFFYIRTTNNGSVVRGKIGITIPTETINPDMQVFFGRSDSIPTIWFPANDSLNTVTQEESDSINYYMEFFNDFEWINCDAYIEGLKSDFTVHVNKNPSEYGTRVYFILNSINSVAELTNWGDNTYTISYLPIDYSGKLFAISFSPGQAYYYLENMTITPVVDKEIELIPVSSSELVTIISNL